jgi:RNA polymerase sigma-70 factor (ECF subfamily)
MAGDVTRDAELINRIRGSDRAACEEMVRANYAAVYRFLVNLTGDAEMAADCTQDTFRIAWQKLADFGGRASIASWLHRIAYNRFIDVYRKSRRERGLQENFQIEQAGIANQELSCVASRRDASQYLSEAVGQLPDEQRAIVALHYFEGLSLAETAAVVGESVGTVKWRLSTALERLRTIVDAEAVQ